MQTAATTVRNSARAVGILCTISLFVTGCADGPFPALAKLNPWLRREWDADEKYALTFHTKLAEINQLAQRAKSASGEEQDRIAQMMAERLQTERNTLLRQALTRGLGSCPNTVAFQALSIQVGDLDADVRIAACQAFGQLKSPEAAGALANVVKIDKQFDVRMAATRELANFPPSEPAVRALGIALDDSNPALQYRAVQSLKAITHRDLGDNVAAWREFVNSGDAFSPQGTPSLVERVKNWF